MTKQTESCIAIVGNRFFDILKPEEHDYDIDCIATALSNICRYTGHVDKFYSVAEHSVLVSKLVPEKYALEGLLHDASEAFLGDVSSPLKKLLPDYKRIENNVQKAMADFYGLVYPYPNEIHEADKRMYWNERKTVAPGPDALWHQEFGAARKVTASGMTPTMAKRYFLSRYKEIINDRKGNEQLQRQRPPEAKAA